LHEIGCGELDALPSAAADQKRQQDQQRKCSTGLREDERVDGVNRFSGERKFAGEDGAAESGGDSPEKRGGGDEQVSAEGVRWTRSTVNDGLDAMPRG
jgi:hypothetical protein